MAPTLYSALSVQLPLDARESNNKIAPQSSRSKISNPIQKYFIFQGPCSMPLKIFTSSSCGKQPLITPGNVFITTSYIILASPRTHMCTLTIVTAPVEVCVCVIGRSYREKMIIIWQGMYRFRAADDNDEDSVFALWQRAAYFLFQCMLLVCHTLIISCLSTAAVILSCLRGKRWRRLVSLNGGRDQPGTGTAVYFSHG